MPKSIRSAILFLALPIILVAGCDSNPTGPSAAVVPAKDNAAEAPKEDAAKDAAKGAAKVKETEYAKP